MSNREKFEAWYLENWGHTEDEHETLFERDPDSDEEYYRLGVRMSHQAWQAATNAMEAKCGALAAELKQSQIDAGCYKKGMEASNERLVQLAAENAGLKSALNPEVIPDAAVEAFTETAIMGHDWNETGEWSWVENDTDVIRAVLEAIKTETPATDAYRDELRAQGIEMAAKSDQFSMWVQQGLRSFAIGVRQGDECADELRKGVQS